MSQYDFGTIDPSTKSGTALASDLNSWRTALHSAHKGASRPAYAAAGTLWINDSGTPWILNCYDGSEDISLGTINATTNAFVPSGAMVTGDIGVTVQAYDADTAKTDVAQTFTASQRATLTTDNDLSFSLAATNYFKCTPTAGGTLTFTSIPADAMPVSVLLVNGSNYAIAAAATTKISASDLAKISATGTYLLSGMADGTNVYLVSSANIA